MAIWLALVSVFSTLSIPIGSVPITLQTFILFLMSAFLTPVESFEVMIAYVVIGAAGLPVFAGFQGGLGVLFGPSGGYILAFPIAAFTASLSWRKRGIFKILGLSLSLFFIYTFGAIVLAFYLKSFEKAVEVGILPFVWIDALKVFTVYLILHKVKHVLSKRLALNNEKVE